MSIRLLARLIVGLITLCAKEGYVLARSFNSIRKALVERHGKYILSESFEEVAAYAEVQFIDGMILLCSVVVDSTHRYNGIGREICQLALDEGFKRQPEWNAVLVCDPTRVDFFKSLGFLEMHKRNAPLSVCGGRTEEEWQECDRVWMMATPSTYHSTKGV